MGDILVKLARTRPVVAVTDAIPPEDAARAAGVRRPVRSAHLVRRRALVADARADRRRASPELDPPHAAEFHERRRCPAARGARDARHAGSRSESPRPPGRASRAGHRPRRLRLLRPALRHRGARPPGDQHRAEAGLQDVERWSTSSSTARSKRSSSSRACRGASIEAVQAAGRGQRPRGRDRRRALLRRHGRRRHARGHVHRHGPPQRRDDRQRAEVQESCRTIPASGAPFPIPAGGTDASRPGTVRSDAGHRGPRPDGRLPHAAGAVGHRPDAARGASSVAIVGPNGAGKTTLIKAILGLVPAGDRLGADLRRALCPPSALMGRLRAAARERRLGLPHRARSTWC